jgi:hypothetical protein
VGLRCYPRFEAVGFADSVLAASAGLKHFGKRRLGRSGIADPKDVCDNVFDFDITD